MRRLLASLGACGVLFSPALAVAQPLGRAVALGEVPWPDPVFGQPTPVDGVRPASVGVLRAPRAPIAVHVGPGVDAAVGAEALADAVSALDALEFHHGFAQPLPDCDRGGDASLDVYITVDGPALDVPVDTLDATWLWDRASAFVRIRTTTDHARLRRLVAEGVARAIVLGAKADHPRAFVTAAGASLARLATGDVADLDAVRAFQAHPERAIFGERPRTEDEARGAGLFLDYMTARWDDDRHKLVKALIVAPVVHTPPGWERLWNEPDLFDIARRFFMEEPGRLEGALAEFSVARAALGTAGDAHLAAGVGDPSLALRPFRTLRYAELPRWVSAPDALEPTGCAVLELSLDDAPLHATMAVWFHGSPWQRWMVRVVRVGGDGRAVGDLGSDVITDGEWSAQLDLLDGFTRARVVVVNLGDMGYDPDAPQSANGFFSINVGTGGR